MPAPSEQVLSQMLYRYAQFRDDLWRSSSRKLIETVKEGVSILANFLGMNYVPTESKKIICEKLQDDIKTAALFNTTEAWLELIAKFVNAADQAQEEVSNIFSNGESLLCATLYGLVNYIVRCLAENSEQKNPGAEKEKELIKDILHIGFMENLNKLRKQLDETKSLIKISRKQNNSRDVQGLKAKRAILLKELTYLGDVNAGFKAQDYRLFEHLNPFLLTPNACDALQANYGFAVNSEMNVCVQPSHTFEIIFYMYYEEIIKSSPHQFIKECLQEEANQKRRGQLVIPNKRSPSLPTSLPAPDESLLEEFDINDFNDDPAAATQPPPDGDLSPQIEPEQTGNKNDTKENNAGAAAQPKSPESLKLSTTHDDPSVADTHKNKSTSHSARQAASTAKSRFFSATPEDKTNSENSDKGKGKDKTPQQHEPSSKLRKGRQGGT